jgi:hypothetical protein
MKSAINIHYIDCSPFAAGLWTWSLNVLTFERRQRENCVLHLHSLHSSLDKFCRELVSSHIMSHTVPVTSVRSLGHVQ